MTTIAHLAIITKDFPTQLHKVEKEIWVDFQTLDTALASRILRLDHLEQRVKTAGKTSSIEAASAREELRRVKEENEVLQSEMEKIKSGTATSSGAQIGALTTARGANSALTSDASTPLLAGNGNVDNSEAKWIWRIEEMNRRLKAEREGRLLDRDGASRRLQEGQKEIRELRKQLDRVKGGAGGQAGGGRIADIANANARARGASDAGSVD